MMNLHEILEKARSAGQRLPYNEAAVLYAAVVRLAAAHGLTLRGRLIQIDEAGGLQVAPFDADVPEGELGYLAPELLGPDAPAKDDPRVQVYASAALGYELLTGKLPPQPGSAPGAELSGALGDVVRLAMAPDPRARYGDLKQLHDAVEVVQPRPPAEGERNILSALRMRFSRPSPEKEAPARVIEKLRQLELQVGALAKAHARLEAAQQQSLETIDRFEESQRRLDELNRRPKSSIAPAVLAGVLTSVAVLAAAWALKMIAPPAPLLPGPAPVATPPPPEPTPAPAVQPAVPDPAVAEPKPPPPVPAAEPADAGAAPAVDASVAATDAGVPDAAVAAAPVADAGPPAVAAAPPQPAPPMQKRPPNPRTAMQHAVALSQVRRGEAALEQGRVDEALASFREALDTEPTNAAAFRGLGMAYAMQGDDAQALQSYDKYLRLAPAAPDAAEIRQSIRELRTRAKTGAKQQ